jgi:RNA polymerase sigma-70 factor (ECF subfamily)
MTSLTWKTLAHAPEIAWRFDSFNQDYLQRLASGDAAVEHHFGSYFGDLLLLKLRNRIRSPQLIEDIRQETLLRVLRIVRKGAVEHPERFGSFVCGVCNNVMMEMIRGEIRYEWPSSEFELADDRVDLEGPLITQQRRRQVESVLAEMPERDRELLRMFFLQECDKNEICKRFKVQEDYLRVLLHRAKLGFRSKYSKRFNVGSSSARSTADRSSTVLPRVPLM